MSRRSRTAEGSPKVNASIFCGALAVVVAVFSDVFSCQLISRIDVECMPLPAESGSFNRACMVAHAMSAWLASSLRLAS